MNQGRNQKKYEKCVSFAGWGALAFLLCLLLTTGGASIADAETASGGWGAVSGSAVATEDILSMFPPGTHTTGLFPLIGSLAAGHSERAGKTVTDSAPTSSGSVDFPANAVSFSADGLHESEISGSISILYYIPAERGEDILFHRDIVAFGAGYMINQRPPEGLLGWMLEDRSGRKIGAHFQSLLPTDRNNPLITKDGAIVLRAVRAAPEQAVRITYGEGAVETHKLQNASLKYEYDYMPKNIALLPSGQRRPPVQLLLPPGVEEVLLPGGLFNAQNADQIGWWMREDVPADFGGRVAPESSQGAIELSGRWMLKKQDVEITFAVDPSGGAGNRIKWEDGRLITTVSIAAVQGATLDRYLSVLPVPVPSAGYVFTGWSPSRPTAERMISGDTVFTARFARKPRTDEMVTIEFRGMDGELRATDTVAYGTAYKVLKEPPPGGWLVRGTTTGVHFLSQIHVEPGSALIRDGKIVLTEAEKSDARLYFGSEPNSEHEWIADYEGILPGIYLYPDQVPVGWDCRAPKGATVVLAPGEAYFSEYDTQVGWRNGVDQSFIACGDPVPIRPGTDAHIRAEWASAGMAPVTRKLNVSLQVKPEQGQGGVLRWQGGASVTSGAFEAPEGGALGDILWEIPSPTPAPGWQFDGWEMYVAAAGKTVNEAPGADSPIMDPVVWTAVFSEKPPAPPTEVHVEYRWQNGANDSEPVIWQFTAPIGDKLIIALNGPNGYGWSITDRNGVKVGAHIYSAIHLTADNPLIVDGVLTLTAGTASDMQISYDAYGDAKDPFFKWSFAGISGKSVQVFPTGGPGLTCRLPADVTEVILADALFDSENYSNAGWRNDQIFSFGDRVKPGKNSAIQFSPDWRLKNRPAQVMFVVDPVAGGGSQLRWEDGAAVTKGGFTAVQGASLREGLDSLPTPLPAEGFEFKGWSPAEPKPDALITGDMTWTALFAKKSEEETIFIEYYGLDGQRIKMDQAAAGSLYVVDIASGGNGWILQGTDIGAAWLSAIPLKKGSPWIRDGRMVLQMWEGKSKLLSFYTKHSTYIFERPEMFSVVGTDFIYARDMRPTEFAWNAPAAAKQFFLPDMVYQATDDAQVGWKLENEILPPGSLIDLHDGMPSLTAVWASDWALK